jgi:hypothetical protein
VRIQWVGQLLSNHQWQESEGNTDDEETVLLRIKSDLCVCRSSTKTARGGQVSNHRGSRGAAAVRYMHSVDTG